MNLAQDFADSLAEGLLYDWRAYARPEQLAPAGAWRTWLYLAGRGAGKTRSAAEWVRENVCGSTPLAPGRFKQVALVAETAADARETMVGDGKAAGEGSGLLQVHPKDFRPVFEPSKRRLTWPNGAIATLYNGTEPDMLRGPAHDAAWCDELAKFQYGQETWDQLQFGLRMGQAPQCVVTTTPRPLPLLKAILRDPQTIVTRGKTADNLRNLAPGYVAALKERYGGTRLGRQELEAELLEDTPGALWQRKWIDDNRVANVPPDLKRVVVAVDPSVSTSENADECGICVVGLGQDKHLYVLADLTERLSPMEWAKKAVSAYYKFQADRIVAEVNNGGELVANTIRMVDPAISYKEVRASRGKAIRAEPVSAMYEQGRVHHCGSFTALEDQLCSFTADFDRSRSGYSPDRLDALVWGCTELAVKQQPYTGPYSFYSWNDGLYATGTGPAYGGISHTQREAMLPPKPPLGVDPSRWWAEREKAKARVAREQAVAFFRTVKLPTDQEIEDYAAMLVRENRVNGFFVPKIQQFD